MSVNRHLIESLVQLRYFARRKAALGAQLLATSRKERISFKAMFEDVSPGLYDSQYMTASGVEHSGMALSAFFNYMPPDREAEFARSVPKLRCEYDQRAAGWTANALAMLCAGFLQHYPSWFDGYATVAAQDDMETLRQGTLAIFTEFRSGLRQIAPKPAAFDVWDRLVGRTIRK